MAMIEKPIGQRNPKNDLINNQGLKQRRNAET